MRRVPTLFVLIAAAIAFPRTAAAQQEPLRQKIFVEANVLARQDAPIFAVSPEFPVFGQTATMQIDDDLTGGAHRDISMAIKPWKYLAVGAGFSRMTSDETEQVTSTVPSPVPGFLPFVDRAITPRLKHSEQILYVSALWMKPVTAKFDIALLAGPAFFTVKQDIPTALKVDTAPGIPVPALTVTYSNPEATGKGFHAGMNLNYMFTRVLGGGVMLHYFGGSVDLQSGTHAMSVGGLQIGAGIRARF